MIDETTELSNVMKGRIPRPTDLRENEPLKGEVQRIWDNLTKVDRKGRKQAQAANLYFASKGTTDSLHNALEHAREEGFSFDTEAELLDAVESSLAGDKQYPSMELLENRHSFSIGKDNSVDGKNLKRVRYSYEPKSIKEENRTDEEIIESIRSKNAAPALFNLRREESFSEQSQKAAKHFGELLGFRVIGVSGIESGGVSPYLEPNVILVSKNADRPDLMVVAHEAIHAIKRQRPDIYSSLKENVKADYEAYIKENIQDPVSREHWQEEFLADYLADQIGKPQFWNKLSEKDATVFHRFAEWVIGIIKTIKSKIDAGDRGTEAYVKDLDLAQNAVVDAIARFKKDRPQSEFVSIDEDTGDINFYESSLIKPDQDADYLKAVESGDVETAQAMVDEAAKKAGYDSPIMFHGTDRDFESFDSKYHNSNTKGPKGSRDAFFFSDDRWYAGAYASANDSKNQKILPVYLKFNKLKKVSNGAITAKDLIDSKSDDYDAITLEQTGEIAVFNPNQIKSADPVTYDSDGNVIPLSKRFDESRDEISFSIGDSAPRMVFDKVTAKEIAKNEIVGNSITNKDDGFVAEVTSTTLNKMVSGKALGKSNDNEAHFFAVANVDHIYENSVRIETELPRDHDKGSKLVHKYRAPILHNGKVRVVKLTIKELIQKDQGNRVYSVEIESIEDPASKESSLTDQVSNALTGSIDKLNEKIGEIKNQKNETNTDDQANFSISPENDHLTDRVQDLMQDDSKRSAVYKVLAGKIARIRAKQNQESLLPESERDNLDLINSMAMLDAIAGILPLEVRAKLQGKNKLVSYKTRQGRENYLLDRLDMAGRILEQFRVKEYRTAIKKAFKDSKVKSKNKASDAGQSTIGATGHLIAEAAEAASVMNPDEAELAAAKIRRELENPEPEEEQELEDRAYVTEMFADMKSADSHRLEQLLGILQANWDEGRAEWLGVLKKRKEWKDSTIEKARKAFGVSKKNDGDTTSKTGKSDSLWKRAAKEGVNFYQLTDMMREGDKNESKSIWKEMADDWRRADNENENLNLEYKEEMKFILSDIFGFRKNKQAQVQDRLKSLSKQVKQTKVTKTQQYGLEVAANAQDLDTAEKAYDAGEKIEIRGKTISREEYQDLFIGWQDAVASGFNPEARKLFRHTLIRNDGERSSVGEMSQLDMLKDWLSIQQQDLKTKYEKNGYDAQYRKELNNALEEDVKKLGLWMQAKLKDDQEIQQALHRQEYGLALKLIENYFPAVFEHGGKQSGTTLTMDGIEIGQSSTRPSAHKLRVNHNSRPKKQNAIAVFNGHVMQRNFWQTHAEVMRKWAGVIRDKNMQDYILRAKGQTALNLVNRWLNDTENQGGDVARAQIETDNLWRSLGQGMALGILGGRISTIFKNITAGTNVILGTNFKDLVRGFSPEIINDVKELYESDTFQRRLKMGSTVAARYALESSASGHILPSTLKRAAEYPVQGINLADTLSNLTFALAYRAKIVELQKQGMNEAEAKEQALDHVDDLVARFAQPTSRLSKSLWENTRSPEATFMVMFMSEARKVMAINMLAIRKLSTGKGVGSRADAGRQLMTTIIINSLLIHVVNSLMTAFVKGEGDDPEEEFINQLTDGKKIVASMMTESFSGVPIRGDGWRYGVNKAMGLKAYDSSSNPATKVAKAVSSAYSLMTDDKDRTASEMTDSILRVVQGFGSISPYTAVFSQGANVARDGLGFYNNTLGKGLTDDDSKQLSVDRITKKYSAIKKVDADAYKDADKLEKKQISSARHEAIEQYLLDYLMELPEERRKMVIEELKEKKSVPKDVMKRVEREVYSK